MTSSFCCRSAVDARVRLPTSPCLQPVLSHAANRLPDIPVVGPETSRGVILASEKPQTADLEEVWAGLLWVTDRSPPSFSSLDSPTDGNEQLQSLQSLADLRGTAVISVHQRPPSSHWIKNCAQSMRTSGLVRWSHFWNQHLAHVPFRGKKFCFVWIKQWDKGIYLFIFFRKNALICLCKYTDLKSSNHPFILFFN